eukprot:2216990-Rhodomonas_salina.1
MGHDHNDRNMGNKLHDDREMGHTHRKKDRSVTCQTAQSSMRDHTHRYKGNNPEETWAKTTQEYRPKAHNHRRWDRTETKDS